MKLLRKHDGGEPVPIARPGPRVGPFTVEAVPGTCENPDYDCYLPYPNLLPVLLSCCRCAYDE